MSEVTSDIKVYDLVRCKKTGKRAELTRDGQAVVREWSYEFAGIVIAIPDLRMIKNLVDDTETPMVVILDEDERFQWARFDEISKIEPDEM